MNEQIVKVISDQYIRPAVKQPRALVPDHLPGQEGDGMRRAAVVEYVQLPLLGDRLTDVQDGGDHMRREPEARGLQEGKLLKGSCHLSTWEMSQDPLVYLLMPYVEVCSSLTPAQLSARGRMSSRSRCWTRSLPRENDISIDRWWWSINIIINFYLSHIM